MAVVVSIGTCFWQSHVLLLCILEIYSFCPFSVLVVWISVIYLFSIKCPCSWLLSFSSYIVFYNLQYSFGNLINLLVLSILGIYLEELIYYSFFNKKNVYVPKPLWYHLLLLFDNICTLFGNLSNLLVLFILGNS